MTTTRTAAARALHRDDIAIWPDGTWAHLGDVWNGGYSLMSDDYDIPLMRRGDHVGGGA